MNDEWSDPFTGDPGVENHNTAADNAQVGQQIGVNYGSPITHYESTYHINQDDPPERRHEVAFNHLTGGTPRLAEPLFGDLLWHGDASTERGYYYVLSVLSERSPHEIHGELVAGIVHARKVCRQLPRDGWWEALDVVWRLLRRMLIGSDGQAKEEHAKGEHADGEHLEDVLEVLDRLPAERQDEIFRHLDLIFSGVARERIESTYVHRVVAERMRGERVDRAWLFFEAEPAEPRKDRPAAAKAQRSDWKRAVVGGLFVLLGVLDLLGGPWGAATALAVPVLAVSGYLLVRYGVAREALLLHIAVRDRAVLPPAHPVEARSPGHWVPTAFVREVHELVDRRFSEARPHRAGDWHGYAAGPRAHLKERLVDLYGNAQVEPAALNWLIRWHASRVASGWASREIFQYRSAVTEAEHARRRFSLGVVTAAAGLMILLFAGQVIPAVVIGAGGFAATKGLLRIASLRKVGKILEAEAEELHETEMHGYHEWTKHLESDRPTDTEMARWLALDKIYLKTAAISRARLTSHDLVAHVVMNEGAKGATRARVPQGPPRYSAYLVHIFLLTRSGVREIKTELNFLNGAVGNERWNLFRYGALASASVTERGSRTVRGSGSTMKEVKRLRSRTFRLTLVNGQDITQVTETIGDVEDAALDAESDLAGLQTSGIDSALPILEAVAADGPDWITREWERRERWSHDWDWYE
ncbi:hypothetical protein FDG2_3021 [Candidatus Protofrankia californiensis]|uniref:Uncharacterized protein n=1 Tax=Candidatus Protofrankia californiensis TaxID=1839754 RepID=A0A1C3NYU0_9ACTN|nr:hypothetical protein FDG2_3021 [Candidatus Protofrankia californiensis]